MEKLISSSPCHLFSPLYSPSSYSKRTTLPLVLKPIIKASLSKQGDLPSQKRFSLCPIHAPNIRQKKDSDNFSPTHFPRFTDLKARVIKKVTKSTTFFLLSALIISVTQPFLVHPAHATSGGGILFKSELLSSAWTGFFAGCLHTLSGPDHLAALAPLSIGRTRVESAIVGALWGCGHDAGQLIFGLVFLLLKDQLHIEVIRTWGTRVVGLTLLVIGAMGIREASEVPVPCVALESGDSNVTISEPLAGKGKKKIGFATFATGIVHGLQPDALLMILPALALPSRVAGAAFLGMFLVGTVIAMGSYTAFIGSCSLALKDRVPRITEKLTWAASILAILMGVAIIVSQLFGFSLY